MSVFIETRALAGTNFIRASEVIAVQHVDAQKCNVMMAGGGTLACSEPATTVKARVEAALSSKSEMPHGHGRP